MINNRVNISQYQGKLPTDEELNANRNISDSPIYSASDVLRLAQGTNLHFWSKGAISDSLKWKLDAEDTASLVQLAATSGSFKCAEWCQQQPNGPSAACDAYTVTRLEWNEAAHKTYSTTYYLKLAISKTGTVLLMASNHPEGT